MKKFFAAALCVLFSASAACFAADREHTLKIYNWADYIDEDLLTEFQQWYEEQTGEPVEIIYQLFDINEVMLSKIEKGHEDFDVVCPSDYIIERMLKADLLLPIDKDFGDTPDYTVNVAPFMNGFLTQVDGSGKNAVDYTVPYMWGTVGITYNPRYVSAEEVSTWDVLKDPRFEGKVLMKEAFRDVYTAFNFALNYDRVKNGEVTFEELSYDVSPESIARVEAYLNEMKPNIAGWEADFGKEMMTKEKAWLNLTWSGDAQWAIEEAEAVGVPLDYAVPASGAVVWFDGWVIPKYAKNVQAARYFINFMCKPENALRNMDVIGYVSAIGGDEVLAAMSDSSAYEPIDASYFFGEAGKGACLNRIMYPDASVIEDSGIMHDCGTEELLAMWSRVKGDNASGLTVFIIGAIVVLLVLAFVFSRSRKKHGHRRAGARR